MELCSCPSPSVAWSVLQQGFCAWSSAVGPEDEILNGGQFEEGKKKSEDGKEENEILEEQIETEVERKIQVSLSNMEADVKDSSPRLIGHANCKPHQNQYLPAKIPDSEIKTMHLVNPQDRPVPLPSTLPKRPKAVKKTAPRQVRHSGIIILLLMLSLVVSNGISNLGMANDSDEQRLMDMQRELLLARSMMSHEVTPTGLSATRSIMGSSLSNHSYHTTASTSRRMLNVERAAYYRIGSSKQ
eukprot:CAMPEP_0201918324 /NCGR_PEP_ID=MMETSP0903-20130614/7521_1 /ASSEMBLY_ACC=CAM_ASM_000552 /TAXON_ID=420261 /ORGANISM="Thalassiosira antarctica, Strain CCMP982" /LENGTH=242 /DNA_ID=CAMNT_0048454619 /DNA_START=75 /DNA_END=805 /DNA_ORIENTATION=-